MNVDGNSLTLLSSILTRINMVNSSLPEYCQENLDRAYHNVALVLKKYNFVIEQIDRKSDDKLDMNSLYKLLNGMVWDLSMCSLLFANNVYLEDAVYYINVVMENMLNDNNVFESFSDKNYDGKCRILK